jgi:hypothetical protein
LNQVDPPLLLAMISPPLPTAQQCEVDGHETAVKSTPTRETSPEAGADATDAPTPIPARHISMSTTRARPFRVLFIVVLSRARATESDALVFAAVPLLPSYLVWRAVSPKHAASRNPVQATSATSSAEQRA